jgi:filamentous hemagglutinin
MEDMLAASEYRDWFRVGAEHKGFWPLVDFQKGNVLVSLKTINTRGSHWLHDMQRHIRNLADTPMGVDDQLAVKVLDIRVEPGGLGAALKLVDFGRQHGIKVIIREFPQ